MAEATIARLYPHDWQVETNGGTHEYVTAILANHPALGLEEPDPNSVVFFSGNGELEGGIRAALKHFAHLGVPAVSPLVDLEQVPGDRSHVNGFADRFGAELIPAIQERTGATAAPVAVGNALGAAFIAKALEQGIQLGDLGFMGPAALGTYAMRDRYPGERQAAGALLFRQADPRGKETTLLGAYESLRQNFHDVKNRKLGPKILPLVSYDAMPQILRHALSNTVVISAGKNDRLTPAHETELSAYKHLQNHTPEEVVTIEKNLHFTDSPHGHANITSRAAAGNLAAIVDQIYPKQWLHQPTELPEDSVLKSLAAQIFRDLFGMEEWHRYAPGRFEATNLQVSS